MLPMDAQRNTDAYSYPNGMLNAAYISGVLRKPEEGLCYIQQTRNENHMLPITFDPKKTPLPRNMKEGDLVSAICHVEGEKQGDLRTVRLKSLKFDAPNVMHMDPRYVEDVYEKWKKAAHAAAPDSGIPDSIRALGDQITGDGRDEVKPRVDTLDWRVLKLNVNSSNHVRLAGFIQAKSLEQKRVGVDGKPLNDRLIVLLRQTKDPDRCISLRWYSKNLQPLADRLRKGIGIKISGEFRLDVKAIGAPDPDTHIAPVSIVPYIMAKDYPTLALPGSEDIKVQPSWAYELYVGHAAPQAPDAAPAGEGAPTDGLSAVDRTALFAQALQQPRGE
jgi:hypothetical protein